MPGLEERLDWGQNKRGKNSPWIWLLGFTFIRFKLLDYFVQKKSLCYFDMEFIDNFQEIDDGFSHLEYGVISFLLAFFNTFLNLSFY